MALKTRCHWCGDDPIYIKYHDKEWGVPVYRDKKLFEFLILECAQAGLSWITILKRRAGYKKAFAGFDFYKVAKFGDKKIERLMQDKGIIRNRLKIKSAIQNAKAFIEVRKEFGTFSKYQWSFVAETPIQNHFKTSHDVPATTAVSDAFSKDLKKRGFSFVGSTIIYAYMQAVGMVNDHAKTCFRYQEIKNLSK